MHWICRENNIETYLQRRAVSGSQKNSFEDWLDRLAVMGTIEPVDWDLENGKFFKIPMCCIKWYLFMSKMGITCIAKMTDYIYGPYKNGSNLSAEEQYVRCPKCLKEN